MQGVEEESETMRQFREAAARLAAKRELAAMTADQRVVRALRGWMDEWRADLDGRPVEAVHTTVGLQARPAVPRLAHGSSPWMLASSASACGRCAVQWQAWRR